MSAQRLTFRKCQRLAGAGVFKAVIDARARVEHGAIALHGVPSSAPHMRLGISIGRRVGTAAKRNRIKRLVREAFRLSQREFPSDAPAPYDLVVLVRPHEPLPLAQYQQHLLNAIATLHALWQKRANRKASTTAATTPAPTSQKLPPRDDLIS